ncbi:site-specific DNA-methyltransferase [Chloroflexi bacterium TSY]|nr:site-specific DNA-methyltransferase [Chloroflexi bacterium TSY]
MNQRTMQHALWLSMITPRLILARQLMRPDGLIFISIDDNEVHHLKMVMNEIFGEENFVAQFVWHSSTAGGIRAKYVNRNHEYALCYARDIEMLPKLFAPLSQEAVRQYKRKDGRGPYREKDFAWITASTNEKQRYLIECPDGTLVQPRPGYLFRFVRERFERALQDDLVVFKATKTSPLINEEGHQASWNIYIKKHLGNAMGAPASLVPKSLVGLYNKGTQEIKRLFGVSLFNNPKPTDYLRYFLTIGTDTNSDQGDLVLDFFAGSCSMAHAVLTQNQADGGKRRFIMVQQPEPTPENSRAWLAGFETIAEIGKERIRHVLQEMEDAEEVGFRVYKIVSS